MSKRVGALGGLVALLASWSCGSTVIDPPSSPLGEVCAAPVASGSLEEACTTLMDRRARRVEVCEGGPRRDDAAAIASCVGIATSPGSTLTIQDVDACSATMCSGCGAPNDPTCLGYAANLLFPDHSKKGTLEAGAPCASQIQCASGYCAAAIGESCGHCAIFRAVGEDCGGPFDTCGGDGEAGSPLATCVDGVCKLEAASEGETCRTQPDCQPGLYCSSTSGLIEGVCTPYVGLGGACPRFVECGPEADCTDDGTCVARLPNGESCDEDGVQCLERCVDGVCGPALEGYAVGDPCTATCWGGLSCEDGTCVAPPRFEEGEGCSFNSGAYCVDGLVCADACGGTASCGTTCQVPPSVGQPCAGPMICGPGATCVGFDGDVSPGTCIKLGNESEACPCVVDLTCIDGVCRAYGTFACE